MATTPTTTNHDPLHPRSSNGATLVLQWLTYAFWGWLIVGIIWLLSVILTNVIVGVTVNSVIPYAVAASFVLLPLAFVCDLFYRRHEPLRKNGAAMVIMLIHAVLYALLAIGALITAVFTGLNSLINTVGDSGSAIEVVIIVASISALLYAALFVRVLNPFKKKLGTAIYAWVMLGITVLLLLWAIVVPVAQSVMTRNDRTTEQSLSYVFYGVQSYVSLHDALPHSLNDITTNSKEADSLIKAGKVEYKPEGLDTNMTTANYNSYRYQLCVSYDHSADTPDYSYNGPMTDVDGYSPNINTTPHSAGRVCYKLRT